MNSTQAINQDSHCAGARIFLTVASFAAVVALWIAPVNAHACKVLNHGVAEFWAHRNERQVVFQGKVRSVVAIEGKRKDGQVDNGQGIQFEPIRWRRGGAGNQLVKARSWEINDDGWSCINQFSFHVTEGDELLVVGEMDAGFVVPSYLLSKRMVDGGVPENYLSVFASTP
ncbi:hypothetical protein [Pseudomonas sp. OV226]|uniref:hypothetical protein n=1 Tax=Pseudomonas sp. OV226 TaxID=2135588 RepID=UPI000D6CFAFA|nr:hypothetical protein [Pseudomonas sp. OV226]